MRSECSPLPYSSQFSRQMKGDSQSIFKLLGAGSSFKPDAQKKHFQKVEEPVEPKVVKNKKKNRKRKQPDTDGAPLALSQVEIEKNQHKIKVEGDDVPASILSFDELITRFNCPDFIMDAVTNCNYTTPTPIQSQAIPAMLSGRGLIALAPTGSGKTAAFLIPLLASLKKPQAGHPRGLIVAPSRELAMQIKREVDNLSKGLDFKTLVLTKALSKSAFAKENKTPEFDILITTPMRLQKLVEDKGINMSHVRHVILDEADKLLDMGFVSQVDAVLAACTHPNVQHTMFTATMLPTVEELARTVIKDPIKILVGASNRSVSAVKQELNFVGNEDGKMFAIRQAIGEVGGGLKPPVLVFVRDAEQADHVHDNIKAMNYPADVLHAGKPELHVSDFLDDLISQRDEAVKKFREGSVWMLIATDVISRGLDFKGIETVINYDFSPNPMIYIHRVGRAGRAGRPGRAITYFTEEDVPVLRSVANVIKEAGCEVPSWIATIKKRRKNKKKRATLDE